MSSIFFYSFPAFLISSLYLYITPKNIQQQHKIFVTFEKERKATTTTTKYIAEELDVKKKTTDKSFQKYISSLVKCR